ncbi:MAG: M28 family peptidase [Aquaticitalea sp.]
MKNTLLFIITTLLLSGCGSSQKSVDVLPSKTEMMQPADPTVYGTQITSEDLKEMLYTYASDEFQGRETGEPGQKMAVEYLKQKYVTMGIPPAQSNGNYLQEVPLEKKGFATASLNINGKTFNNFEDVVCIAGDTKTINIKDVIYAGYGIESEKYSDYKDLDVKGKVVLIKFGEPKNEDGTFVTSGRIEPTKWTNGRQALASKRNLAEEKGAKALIMMDNAMFNQNSQYISSALKSGSNGGRLSLKTNEENMTQLIITENLGRAIYKDIDTDSTSKKISADMTISIDSHSEVVTSENVAAFIKGSEKPDEIIVLSAHLDHLGMKNGEVYNGADDDGSGTVSVVEIAKAFKKAADAGHGPKRSILFLHVTGEEKGLLGSRYYTDIDPIEPLANTMVDLNIDMIGRVDPEHETNRNYVYLIGSSMLSTDLHNISEETNNKYSNLILDYKYDDDNDPNRFYYRSDHYNFAKNNIPVIFYFNGTHADYHQLTDTPDKIQFDLLQNRARLVFYTAWELANRDQKIVVDKPME